MYKRQDRILCIFSAEKDKCGLGKSPENFKSKLRETDFNNNGLSCKKSRGRQGRHSALNESIQRALGSAKATSILEPPGLDRGDNKKPDGLTNYPWKFGKPLVWDVTIVDNLASSYIATASAKAGKEAKAA